MAELSEGTLAKIATLQTRLLQVLNRATAAEFTLFSLFEEIEETISGLEELKSVSQGATSRYRRLANLSLRISESQPVVNPTTLELLIATIEDTEILLPALERSIVEVKLDWNLS